jgi:thiol peroxidase
LSDAVWGDFGSSYGLRIKDMGILTRAVLIIDNKGTLVYQQLVPLLSQEPDYAAAIDKLQQLTKN